MYEAKDGRTGLLCCKCGAVGADVAGMGAAARKHCRWHATMGKGFGHLRERGRVTSEYICPECREAEKARQQTLNALQTGEMTIIGQDVVVGTTGGEGGKP